jgi:hypothetical protein
MIHLSRPRIRATVNLCALSLAACLTTGPALAQQDLGQDRWSFNLFNDSGIALAAFQTTAKSGEEGHNWLEEPMLPGYGLTLEFTDPLDTRCEIEVRLTYTNGAVLDQPVNFCGTAVLRLTDDGLFVE